MLCSEPLGEHKGEDEIAQQGDGHDQTDDVVGGHSFVTPLATRATSAKTAIVTTTKATSAIVSSWMRCGCGRRHPDAPRQVPADRLDLLSKHPQEPRAAPVDGSHTPLGTLLTDLIRQFDGQLGTAGREGAGSGAGASQEWARMGPGAG
ncbi:hypothetical protein GCM10010372_76370 [Streptomyces tauricus]|nr:hypothetical protein GCM10010372_76370 [Streptomyces tauricus]